MKVLDGALVAKHLREGVKTEAAAFQARYSRPAKLVVILVGEDKASQVYVNSKAKACQEAGVASEIIRLAADIKSEVLEKKIKDLALDPYVDGILVQMPLPKHISVTRVIDLIPPHKDVDGFTPQQVGLMSLGRSTIKPCTPAGVMEIFKFYGISLEGKDAVVVGRSHIVGAPMAQLLTQANATVTLCHSKTRHLDAYLRNADIVVAAIGKPHFLHKHQLKKGAIIVDVGIHRIQNDDGKSALIGDVNPAELANWAAAMTPVPGGVGPMTIAMLLKNTLILAKQNLAEA